MKGWKIGVIGVFATMYNTIAKEMLVRLVFSSSSPICNVVYPMWYFFSYQIISKINAVKDVDPDSQNIRNK